MALRAGAYRHFWHRKQGDPGYDFSCVSGAVHRFRWRAVLVWGAPPRDRRNAGLTARAPCLCASTLNPSDASPTAQGERRLLVSSPVARMASEECDGLQVSFRRHIAVTKPAETSLPDI
ncbi:hypothetical protein Mpe_B0455 (plasmid) [Methylibium petroleiphilum PM1]|uniref:Uncharacterized protein n=1 Tax=Methylibium petroleiphilum (strain ATCC BAA-1232 / LMG 22953 / PM1) TaxID=420662 RepID=A2SNQ5_METPP|nr:hypothetical protein Mpe_B0419 [Methylibium petroleiphilum PM1]ABM97228.1 hypothetical protein Mpe_B0455 [Methylibium petroleiphilum PM1]